MSHDLLVQMAYSCAILPHFVLYEITIFFFLKYLDAGKNNDIYLVALNKLYCSCGSWSRMNYLDVLREKNTYLASF